MHFLGIHHPQNILIVSTTLEVLLSRTAPSYAHFHCTKTNIFSHQCNMKDWLSVIHWRERQWE